MRSNDHDAFKAVLADAYALYRADLTAGVLELWWNALKPHNLADVKKALAEHMANPDLGQFSPKPADLIKRIHDATKGPGRACTHCGALLSATGFTSMFGGICNPCYGDYLAGKWPERAA